MNSNKEVNETLLSLKRREEKPAYGLKYNEQSQFLSRCYYFLRFNCNQTKEIYSTNQSTFELGNAIRSHIVNFLFDAADHFGETREIAFVAIDYLDRFLLTRLRHDNENILPKNTITLVNRAKALDLYVFASLGLAIKLFSPCSGCPKRGQDRNFSNEFSSQKTSFLFVQSAKERTFVYNGYGYSTFVALIGGGKEIAEGISTAEASILHTLQWYVHPPTSYRYIQTMFNLVPLREESLRNSLRQFAQFQAELAMSDKGTCRCPPSIIAVSAISNSIQRHLMCINLWNTEEPKQKEWVREVLKNIIKQMETSLDISFEFDERIVALRGVLTKQTMKMWRMHIDSIQSEESQHSDKDPNARPPQGSQFLHLKNLEQCFFLENLEGLLPTFNPVEDFSYSKHRDNNLVTMHAGDLESHYNKYIRPKLYSNKEEIKSTGKTF